MSQIPVPGASSAIPKGLKFTVDAANKAGAKSQFITVNQLGKNGGKRFITGAPRVWKKPETSRDVYNTQWRIAGTPEAIAEAIGRSGIPADINSIIANSISVQNYTNSMAQEYANEKARLDNYKATDPKAGKGKKVKYDSRVVVNFLVAVYLRLKLTKGKLTVSPGGAVSPKKSTRGDTLANKLAKALSEGKVLKVTDWNGNVQSAVKATGVILSTTPSDKTLYYPGVPVIASSQTQQSINNYRMAVEALGYMTPQVAAYLQRYTTLTTAAPFQQAYVPAPAQTAFVQAPAQRPPSQNRPAAPTGFIPAPVQRPPSQSRPAFPPTSPVGTGFPMPRAPVPGGVQVPLQGGAVGNIPPFPVRQ